MKPALHKSQISLFNMCPVAYEFRYCQGLILPPAAAMLAGTGVHASAAQDLTSKRDTGALLPLDQVKETAAASVNAEWEKSGVALDDEERLLGEKRVRGETIDTAVSLAELHHRELAPTLQPRHIERPFTVELNGFPCDISGTLDIQESTGTLRDLKTRSASPPEGLADGSLDLSFYALAARALDGVAPPVLALDVLVKTKRPKLVTLTTTRGEGAYRATLLRIEAVCKAIESGAFPPCSPDSWNCSRKWCGYWSICDHGEKART